MPMMPEVLRFCMRFERLKLLSLRVDAILCEL